MMENQSGLMTGYYIGLFARFVWFLFIGLMFQTSMIYIFGMNYFTYYIIAAIISFIINTSLPIKDSYPFFRHILIYISLIYVVNITDAHITLKLLDIYYPDRLWSALIITSFVVGIFVSIGRYGNGSKKNLLESFGNLILIIFIVIAFILYWWKGGVVYLLFRIPLIFLEVMIGNAILYYAYRKNNPQLDESIEA